MENQEVVSELDNLDDSDQVAETPKKPKKQIRNSEKARRIREQGWPLLMRDWDLARYMKERCRDYNVTEYTDFIRIFKQCAEEILMRDDGRLQLVGFGTFSGTIFPAKLGKNFHTKEWVVYEAGKRINFQSARGLRDRYRVLRDTKKEEKEKQKDVQDTQDQANLEQS